MGRLDPRISNELNRRVEQLQTERGLSAAATVILREKARAIVAARIRLAALRYDNSISPENNCQGIAPIIEATVSQACLDATRSSDFHVVSRI
jgi:hypothetical protein